MIPSTIFRAYDIRGTYPDQLNRDSASLIGRAFAAFLINIRKIERPSVVVGRDNRTHGEELQQAFVRGLSESGVFITDVGLSTTPLLYYAATAGGFDAGCNVSASHNPAQYNGFKLVGKNAHAIFGQDLQTIYGMIEKMGDAVVGPRDLAALQKPKTAHFFDRYLAKIRSVFPQKQGLKIVVDTGNGVAGAFYPQALEALGNTVIPLFAELDGTFPNHPPDPIVEENLMALKKAVLTHQADLGIAFDGDGDRLGVVDEKGYHWNADSLAMLYAGDALARHPDSHFVFTVSNSQLLFDAIQKQGGTAHMCPVGHSYVEEAMQRHGAILGGEQSGHFFLSEDYFPYDDALMAAGRLLDIRSRTNQSFSSLFSQLPRGVSAPELRPYCPDEVKFGILEKIKTYFLKKYPEGNTLDGIRIPFGRGGWAGIRVSNTSPCLSICMEAADEKQLNEIRTIVLGHLKTYPEIRFSP